MSEGNFENVLRQLSGLATRKRLEAEGSPPDSTLVDLGETLSWQIRATASHHGVTPAEYLHAFLASLPTDYEFAKRHAEAVDAKIAEIKANRKATL